jgi:membrane-associated phospholipid phosphatase
MNLKDILYNWFGYNEDIFVKINLFTDYDKYKNIIYTLDCALSYENFGYHLAILFLISGISLFLTRHNKPELIQKSKQWFEFFAILITSLLAGYVIISFAKNYLEYERPFCNKNLLNIYSIKDITKNLTCNHSFPSGHCAYITILASSIWLFTKSNFRLFLIPCVIIVALTRIISAAHFPSDVTGGVIIGIIVTICSKFFIHAMLRSNNKLIRRFIPWLQKK